MSEESYWVAFNLVKGVGSVRFRALLDFFGSLETAWNAPLDALRQAGLPSKSIEHLLSIRRSTQLDNVLKLLEKFEIQVLTWESKTYPRRLKEVDQPPPVLYVRGNVLPEDDLAVGVVGTRRVTLYGRQAAEELAVYLAQNGVTLVSGMARGTDAVAHEAVLKAGGRTLAVLGCGVDTIYPPEHRKLADQIMAQGALISDYPPGTQPEASNFPPRNRIISGLSHAVVVIEAGETSGALITAAFAVGQGREVLALPGNIYAPQSIGTNRLIQQGARPLLRMQDVLEAINLERSQQFQQARILLPANAVEEQLLEAIGQESLHIDEICVRSGLPIEQVSATLTMMELKGMLRQQVGMHYSVMREAQILYRTEMDD